MLTYEYPDVYYTIYEYDDVTDTNYYIETKYNPYVNLPFYFDFTAGTLIINQNIITGPSE